MPAIETPVLNPPAPSNEGVLANLDTLLGQAFQEKASPRLEAKEPKEEKKDTPEEEKDKPKADDKKVPEFDPDAITDKPKEDKKEDEAFPKSSQHWKEYKAKQEAKLAEAVKLAEERVKKQMGEQAPLVKPEEYENLKKQLTDFEQRLIVTNIERHPKFQQYFEGKTTSLVETAKKIGGEKIANLIQLPDGQHRDHLLNEAMQELSPIQQSQVGAVLLQLNTLQGEKASELSRAQQSYQALQLQQKQQAQAQQDGMKRVLEETITRWSDPEKGSPLLKEGAADADKIKAQARAIFTGELETVDMAKASLWAAKGPYLAKSIKALMEENAALKEERDQLRGAKPSIDGGGDDKGGGEVPAGAGFLESVMSQIGKI